MNLHAEAFGNDGYELVGAHWSVFGPVLEHEVQNVGGDLVRPSGSAALRHQTLEAVFAKGTISPDAARYRGTEATGGSFKRGTLLRTADHLVADLKDVSGIKKVTVLKQGVRDFFRVGVKRSGSAEAFDFVS